MNCKTIFVSIFSRTLVCFHLKCHLNIVPIVNHKVYYKESSASTKSLNHDDSCDHLMNFDLPFIENYTNHLLGLFLQLRQPKNTCKACDFKLVILKHQI